MTMKKKTVILCVLIVVCTLTATGKVFAQEIDSYTRDNLITSIQDAKEPVVSGDYVIFTAEKNSRHTGIAFDFEGYRTIHSFERLDSHDTDNEITSSVYFYILEVPKNISTVGYRLVIDGLWTTDPLNPLHKYDRNTNTQLSLVQLNRAEVFETEKHETYDGVHFVYTGQTGQEIRIAGTFTNWDSFIYYMSETQPGVYELNLPLPRGTYYYAFYSGVSQIRDVGNPNQVYTADGRIASVIQVD